MCMNMKEEGKAYTCIDTHMQEFRDMKMQMEKDDRHMSKVMSTSIGTVTQMSIRFEEKEGKKNKKNVINMEQNTNHTYEYGDKCV